MKKSELKSLIQKASVAPSKDNKKHYVVDLSEQLSKVLVVSAANEDDARTAAFDMILSESDNIRGFKVTE